MLRIDGGPGTLTLVTRFSRPRALAIVAGAVGILAVLSARAAPGVAAALGIAATLVAVVGGRVVRAVFAGGRVRVRAAPFGRAEERSLSRFTAVRIETLADARRRKAERHALAYRTRAGSDLPSWLRPADQPGANDYLRRLVLEAPGEEPFAVTAWLAEDALEPARDAVAGLVGRG
jgi:hypothetical protein